jgi:protein CpxP
MARIVSLLALFICFSLTINAQKKQFFKNKKRLTTEQLTTLKVKKMTLELELSEIQQNKLTPVIKELISERSAQLDKKRELKNDVKKINPNERYQMANKILDRKIMFQKEMRTILNEEQFKKFKTLEKKRNEKMKKRRHQKKKDFMKNK